MTIKRRMNQIFRLTFFITLIFSFTNNLQAQSQLLDSLRTIIRVKEDSLAQAVEFQKRIVQTFDAVNEKIYKQKKELVNSSNPILQLRLKGNLKESARIAGRMDELQEKIRRLRKGLRKDYRTVITVADSIINNNMQILDKANDDSIRIATLNRISKIEMEKKVWQKKLSELAPAVSMMPSLEIEPDDNIERLLLKIKILHDRIKHARGEIEKLNKSSRELNSDLQIYREMVSFMDNLQQNIDPEQEYFDQERSDQLKEEVRNIELRISRINEQKKQLLDEKTKLTEKLKQFEKYVQDNFKK